MLLSFLIGGHKMTNAELVKLVVQQQERIDHVTQRLSSLADDVAVLNNSVETFKGLVANDIKQIVVATGIS